MSKMKDQVIEEIKRLCGRVERMPGVGYSFWINNTLCLYLCYKGNESLRFVIPNLATTTEDNKNMMLDMVNHVNREVKYIKAALLDNGSLKITYDHKVFSKENPREVVSHIIKALDFASGYIREKIEKEHKN